jgi:hypothetical protein
MLEQANGWVRWDRVYQSVLSWPLAQLNIKMEWALSSREIQENNHAYCDIGASVDAKPGASSNDRGTANQATTVLSEPRMAME